MKEKAEELAAKHTRRELEGMAEKLGIKTIGIGNKTNLAEAIIKAKEPGHKVEAHRAAASIKAQHKPSIGKKGVLAKRAAIDAQIKENEEAVAEIDTGVQEVKKGIRDMRSTMNEKAKEMIREGSANLQKGVREMHRSIGAQVKENEKAAAKMGTGVKELQNSIEEMQSAMDKKAKKMLQEGTTRLQKGVREMHTGINEFKDEIREFQNETANYIKDFYYG